MVRYKRIGKTTKHRAREPGARAPDDTLGPKVKFFVHVPIKHRQSKSGAELWAAMEAPQGFWVPKVAIFIDSQYLQQGANVKAQSCKSRGRVTVSGALKAHVLVWELLLSEMSKPSRPVRWEHVMVDVLVHGNEVAHGLAMGGRAAQTGAPGGAVHTCASCSYVVRPFRSGLGLSG